MDIPKGIPPQLLQPDADNNPGGEDNVLLQILYDHALLLADSGRYEAAAGLLDVVVETGHSSDGLALLCAKMAVRLGRFGEARAWIKQAMISGEINAAELERFSLRIQQVERFGWVMPLLASGIGVMTLARPTGRFLYRLGRLTVRAVAWLLRYTGVLLAWLNTHRIRRLDVENECETESTPATGEDQDKPTTGPTTPDTSVPDPVIKEASQASSSDTCNEASKNT